MVKKFYVYEHAHPETGHVFYVGKGTADRCRSKNSRTAAWLRYVKALEAQGLTFSANIIKVCATEPEAFEEERRIIASKLDNGIVLFNIHAPQLPAAQLIVDDPIGYSNGPSVLASFVKSKRIEMGYTQEQFASRSKVGLRFVRELEQGKLTVRTDKVNQVLNELGYQLGAVRRNYV